MCVADIGNQCVGGWQQQGLLADSSPNNPLGPLTERLLGPFQAWGLLSMLHSDPLGDGAAGQLSTQLFPYRHLACLTLLRGSLLLHSMYACTQLASS